ATAAWLPAIRSSPAGERWRHGGCGLAAGHVARSVRGDMVGERTERHRTSDVIALREVAAEIAPRLQVVDRLDALGHHPHAEVVPEVDHRTRDGLAHLVGRH